MDSSREGCWFFMDVERGLWQLALFLCFSDSYCGSGRDEGFSFPVRMSGVLKTI
jgi:hypothetical protein